MLYGGKSFGVIRQWQPVLLNRRSDGSGNYLREPFLMVFKQGGRSHAFAVFLISLRLFRAFQKLQLGNINIVMGRKKEARLFPNGKPDKLNLESDRKNRNSGISAILAAIVERIATQYPPREVSSICLLLPSKTIKDYEVCCKFN